MVGIPMNSQTDSRDVRSNVLQFFKDCNKEEENVQKYIDSIIKDFFKPSPSIYASNTDTIDELKLKYGNSQIPNGICCDSKCTNNNELATLNYFNVIKNDIVDKATRVSSPTMIGHMTTALPYFHRPLSKLITSMNQNVVKVETSATATFIERETLSKMHRAFYNQPSEFYEKYLSSADGALGCITSGGTIANITAMWVARNYAFPKSENFEGIEKEGIISALRYYGYNNMAIVGSELMHYSFKKAADILGLGLNGLYTVPVDSDFKIRIDLLIETLEELKAKSIKVIAIVGIACTTEMGSIDDLEALADIAKKYNALFHVDGAWGGSFIFSDKHRHLLKGIEKADTITVDGHKLLYTPMGCGMVLFQSPLLPVNTIRKTASYIIRASSMDHGKTTLEGSRPAAALYFHASLSLLGYHGLGYLLNTAVDNAKYMANSLMNYPQFEIIGMPVTNIFLYRYIPSWLRKGEKFNLENGNISSSLENVFTDDENKQIDQITTELQQKQSKEGRAFVSRTIVKCPKYRNYQSGIAVLRVVISNPLVTLKDIDSVIQEQLKFAEELEKEFLENKLN